jgi:hypothetical protein
LLMAPPLSALLPLKVALNIPKVPPFEMAPPFPLERRSTSVTVFPLRGLLTITRDPRFSIPPPMFEAVFELRVLFLIVSVPPVSVPALFRMLLFSIPPPIPALFAAMVLLFIVRLPLLSMPHHQERAHSG